MRRRAKPTKPMVDAKPPLARKSLTFTFTLPVRRDE